MEMTPCHVTERHGNVVLITGLETRQPQLHRDNMQCLALSLTT